MATSASRQHVKAVCEWLVANEPQIGYSQGQRRMELVRLREQQVADGFKADRQFLADCSGFATAVCKWAGLADPNGLGYNGTGYTGTMLNYLPHYSDPAAANIGALVVWRSATKMDGHHVATVIETGRDPLLCSHGQNAGPIKIRFAAETTVQRSSHGPTTEAVFLNISAL